jgi:hypothetical protein
MIVRTSIIMSAIAQPVTFSVEIFVLLEELPPSPFDVGVIVDDIGILIVVVGPEVIIG